MKAEQLKNINLRPGTLEECWVVIAQLVELNLELLERLSANSNNSSLPPSQDLKKPKKKAKSTNRKPSGKKQGAQKGHKGKGRSLVPAEEVDELQKCEAPSHCSSCEVALRKLSQVTRHQVYELPLPRYQITEYQIEHSRCPCCSKRYSGTLPKQVGRRGFGTRTHAILGLLSSKYKQSKRQAVELLKDLYGLPICVGSVSNIESRVSDSLSEPHKEIKAALDASRLVHIDETGFKQENKSGWAWILSSSSHTYFHLNHSRGRRVAKSLIGNFLGRVIISDRYAAYEYLSESSHQVCWAHLKRDCQKISERAGQAGVVGRELLHYYGKLYGFWKATSSIEGAYLLKKTRKKRNRLKNKFIQALRRGIKCGHKKTSRSCEKILSQGKSLWLFLEDPEVPATNNHAERQLRPLVIAKKLSFGVQSERGARFIERAYSAVMTCKQQKRDVMRYFTNSIEHYFTEIPAPSLLLVPDT